MSDGMNAPAPTGGQDPAPDPGTQPAATPEPAPAAQPPAGGGEAQPQDQSGGQDFIAPYLEGVDPSIRDTVADRLEAFRKDQDANVTKRFQQVNDQLEAYKAYGDPQSLQVPVQLYQQLLDQPVETLEWIVDRFHEEAGQDLRGTLVERLQAAKQQAGQQPSQQQGGDQQPDDQPLTRRELEQWHQEQQRQQQQQEQQRQATEQVNGWISEAAESAGLQIGNDPAMRQAVMIKAKELMPQAQNNGKQAINMAVEAIKNGFVPQQQAAQTDPQPSTDPRVATGGGGAPAGGTNGDVDWSDEKVRREAMLSQLTGGQGT